MTNAYPYNDDLPERGEPSGDAVAEYEPLEFALFFPALRARVVAADEAATQAKRRVRNRGLWSIGLVTLALLGASAEPLYHSQGAAPALVVLFAALGIVGGLLGFLNRSDDWLEQRLVTESLRQLYFRLLIQLAPEILEVTSGGDPARFERKRAAALAAFEQDLVLRRDSALQALIEETGPPAAPPIDPAPDPSLFDHPHGRTLLRAYRNLRILKQRQYADHKLKAGGSLSSFPRAQAAALSVLGLACVGILFATHTGSALLTVTGNELSAWLHLVPIWIAILALAIRALEEGLRPRADVERYRHYQAATRRILERFDAGDTPAKLRAAEELERAAFDEMVIFLRAYDEAHFVL